MALAHQSSLAQKGSAQEASSSFDGALVLDTYFQYSQVELLTSEVKGLRDEVLELQRTIRSLERQVRDLTAENMDLLRQMRTTDRREVKP